MAETRALERIEELEAEIARLKSLNTEYRLTWNAAEDQLAEARAALMRADAWLCHHTLAAAHPVRGAIYNALRRAAIAQTGGEP